FADTESKVSIEHIHDLIATVVKVRVRPGPGGRDFFEHHGFLSALLTEQFERGGSTGPHGPYGFLSFAGYRLHELLPQDLRTNGFSTLDLTACLSLPSIV